MPDSRIPGRFIAHDLPGVIRRAIVDNEDFMDGMRLLLAASDGSGNAPAHIVRGNHYGDSQVIIHCCSQIAIRRSLVE